MVPFEDRAVMATSHPGIKLHMLGPSFLTALYKCASQVNIDAEIL